MGHNTHDSSYKIPSTYKLGWDTILTTPDPLQDPQHLQARMGHNTHDSSYKRLSTYKLGWDTILTTPDPLQDPQHLQARMGHNTHDSSYKIPSTYKLGWDTILTTPATSDNWTSQNMQQHRRDSILNCTDSVPECSKLWHPIIPKNPVAGISYPTHQD